MTDILLKDHAEVDALLRELANAFDGGNAREVFPKLDYLWARLAVHIRAEHLRLFPALLAEAESSGAPAAPTPREVREVVERLREDHDFFMKELAATVNEVRTLAAEDGPPDAARLRPFRERVLAVAARLAEHNRLEEEQVYLWPGLMLSEVAREELWAGMRHEVENLPPRFDESAQGV